MSPEQQRIAIAEACGLIITNHEALSEEQWRRWYNDVVASDVVPDYLSDLNAMHEAEKVLNNDEVLWHKYRADIIRQVHPHVHYMHATAAQRAEAFLRTIGKWYSS